MRSNRLAIYLAVSWILSVAVGYAIGWWQGVSSVTRVATGAARSGFPVIIIALVIVAVLAAVGAFRARGYLDRR